MSQQLRHIERRVQLAFDAECWRRAMTALKITYKDPGQLRPRARNPRTHTPTQIKQIAASIKEFGFVNPVLIDGSDNIIAGHGRVEAAKLLGMGDIPTVRVDHLTPAQVRAYVIADNRLAELAGWDRRLLALELQELSVQPNFDVAITGFETAEVDILIGDLNEESPDEADEVPEVDRTKPAISQAGDLWRIGDHHLLCRSALDQESYRQLLRGAKAQLVFTDPPYNVAIGGHVSGLGKNKHREFAMASGEMTRKEFTQFLSTAFEHLCTASADGSIHFICMDWRHMREVLDAADKTYGELKNLCIWTKTNAGMGSFYRSQHELVFVFRNGDARHINNVELGRFGRNRSNVWHYAGVNSFGKDRDTALGMHPTVKPLALVADAIMDCSKRGAIVLDAFAGSGTTLIAAERTGRRGCGIELDPHYVDTIVKRFDDLYGIKAVHLPSNKSFEDIETERSGKGRHGWQGNQEERKARKDQNCFAGRGHEGKRRSR
jgi:DNA modification methylase